MTYVIDKKHKQIPNQLWFGFWYHLDNQMTRQIYSGLLARIGRGINGKIWDKQYFVTRYATHKSLVGKVYDLCNR